MGPPTWTIEQLSGRAEKEDAMRLLQRERRTLKYYTLGGISQMSGTTIRRKKEGLAALYQEKLNAYN